MGEGKSESREREKEREGVGEREREILTCKVKGESKITEERKVRRT